MIEIVKKLIESKTGWTRGKTLYKPNCEFTVWGTAGVEYVCLSVGKKGERNCSVMAYPVDGWRSIHLDMTFAEICYLIKLLEERS